jgi:hypothetical protein
MPAKIRVTLNAQMFLTENCFQKLFLIQNIGVGMHTCINKDIIHSMAQQISSSNSKMEKLYFYLVLFQSTFCTNSD